MRSTVLVVLGITILTACEQPAAHSRPVAQGGVVDSIFPVGIEIERFERSHATRHVESLDHGRATRDELVADFIAAVQRRDTLALAAMSLDASEFIEIYYPVSPFVRPPYRQSPAFVWFQFQQNSAKGLGRVLARYAARIAAFDGYRCEDEPVPLGHARLWENCRVTWSLTPTPIRLFGTILEHNGSFKFVSFANDL